MNLRKHLYMFHFSFSNGRTIFFQLASHLVLWKLAKFSLKLVSNGLLRGKPRKSFWNSNNRNTIRWQFSSLIFVILRTDFLDDASRGSLFISVCMVSECNPKRMLDDVLHYLPKNIVPFNHRFWGKKGGIKISISLSTISTTHYGR